jgi:hypothetical protein
MKQMHALFKKGHLVEAVPAAVALTAILRTAHRLIQDSNPNDESFSGNAAFIGVPYPEGLSRNWCVQPHSAINNFMAGCAHPPGPTVFRQNFCLRDVVKFKSMGVLQDHDQVK